MIIDIKDYTERWLNDYIVYHYGHFATDYGDLSKADAYFTQKFKDAMDDLNETALTDQMDAIQNNMKSLAPEAAQALNLYNSVSDGTALESAMEQIANAVNEGVSLAYNNNSVNPSNYEQILQSAESYKGMLSNGTPGVAQVNEFFNLILEAMTMAGKIDTSFLTGLTNIGQELVGENATFSLDPQWSNRTVKTVTKRDLEACTKVLQYLQNALTRFNEASYQSGGVTINKQKGTLSAASFGGTIANIFNRQIGERLSRTILAKGISAAMKDPNSQLQQLVQSGELKLGTGRFTLGGDRRDVANRSSKVDIFNQNAFQLSLVENGQTYEIQIGMNTSVKWYGGLKQNAQIHLIAGSPLGSYFQSGTEEHYLAYNVIAHRASPGDYAKVFRTVKAATAATFFNQWISGTGASIRKSTAYINKVQYLMVNGKIYSVMRIIRNICNEIARTNNWNSAFNMSIERKDSNKWIGQGPDKELAMKRSQLVNGVMDKLTIGATLNSNILLRYAY